MKTSYNKSFMIILTLLALIISVLGISPASTAYALGANVAPSATSTSSSEYSILWLDENAIDGSLATEWAALDALPDATPWIQLNWGTPQLVDTIKLYDRTTPTAQITSGTLSFSSGANIAVGSLDDTGVVPAIITFTPRTISWVRFQVNTETGADQGLREFEVFKAPLGQLAGDVTITALPTFHNDGNIDLKYKVINMDPGTKYILAWSRLAKSPANLWTGCYDVANTTLATASGTHPYTSFWNDQEKVEFYITVDSDSCLGSPEAPATAEAAMVSTFIDGNPVFGFIANPPSVETVGFDELDASCNTFELWGLASDTLVNGGTFTTDGYSGFDAWNEDSTGAFAPPAPEGSTNSLLSWMITIPASASGAWNFWVLPNDVADNGAILIPSGGLFRDDVGNVASIGGPEKQACKDFTDATGHADETYFRYLGDLGILAGNPDGSFGPNNTLTRAEASVMFETANGYTAATLPTAAPSAACTFTDVLATDWFAGWVWQACDDGFMNGTATPGIFDPSNTFTRGQAVTVLNNIAINGTGTSGSFLDDGSAIGTVLNFEWLFWPTGGPNEFLRESAWTDVALGAYYATPVVYAYGVGVADGTSATTFSPDQPILRGEFAKMLYRALSRVW